jgi:F420-non-reducing hydrogenase iron-sulfur subunit
MPSSTVVVFTCNWNAYGALEAAGTQRLEYGASIRPLKVMCLGQLSSGTILKAFEKGAGGVFLLACPPGECHYEFGNRRAEEVFAQAKELAALLGLRDEQLALDSVGVGQGATFVARIQSFCAGLNGKQG